MDGSSIVKIELIVTHVSYIYIYKNDPLPNR